jgi:hypothetical protein
MMGLGEKMIPWREYEVGEKMWLGGEDGVGEKIVPHGGDGVGERMWPKEKVGAWVSPKKGWFQGKDIP